MITADSIHSPADIKGLDAGGLRDVAEQLRALLIKKLALHGGHVGPNLGVVEATVALHYVFDAPKDKLVFDVSHQTYVHKMLTGRIEAFSDPAHYNDVTGYTCPRESEYDLFEVGHTSTSISLAVGLAEARKACGGDERIVAFIGDASLGGGQALEALDYAPTLNANFTVILNDNQMSIAENHGALYEHLTALRNSDGHAPNNIFKALGYEYIYVRDGNDIQALIAAFKAARDADHAVLVHINTMKGAGLPVAEAYKERFHYTAPFDSESGALRNVRDEDDYTDVFAKHMLERMHADRKLMTLTAGTPGAFGFTPARRKEAGEQFIDVGICEQAAVAVSAGIAKGGCRPVFGVMATFIQRAYDQLSHDVAINNLPAVFVDFAGGVRGITDVTHLGFFDIAMISNIPNIVFLAPTNADEYVALLDAAINQTEHPVFVRTPAYAVTRSDRKVSNDMFKYETVRCGCDVAVFGVGSMYTTASEACKLMEDKGLNPTLINPRNLSQLDIECLETLKSYKTVITVEDGIVDGGFGQKIAAYLSPFGVEVHVVGLQKEFVDRYDVDEILKANGMTAQQIASLAIK